MELVLTKVRSIQVDTYKLRRLDHRRLYCDTAHFDMKKGKKKETKSIYKFMNLGIHEFVRKKPKTCENESEFIRQRAGASRLFMRLSRIIRDCSIYCI